MAESDTTLGEVVRGEFEGDFIARQNAYAVAAEAARKMREHQTFVLKLHTEFTAGEFLDDRALYFYAVFFTHSCLLTIFFPVIVAEPAPSAW
jgi:hypothetical protein